MDLQEYKRGFHPIYILPILYLVMVYTFPIIFLNADLEGGIMFLPLLIPIVFAMVNFVMALVLRGKIDRLYFLNFAIIIKYCLIPFYMMGVFAIFFSIIIMFMPIVITVFIGPMLVIFFVVMGWIIMIGSAPYAIVYIENSCQEQVHGKLLSLVAKIMQFFFMADIIAVMVLAFKEGKWRKLIFTALPFAVISLIIIWKIIDN